MIMKQETNYWMYIQVLLFTLAVFSIGFIEGSKAQPPQVPETRLGQNWNEQAREQQEYSRQLREQQQIQRNTRRLDVLEQDTYYNTGWEWRLGY